MLFTNRTVKSTLRLPPFGAGLKDNAVYSRKHNHNADIVLVGALFLLILVGGSLFTLWRDFTSLEEQKLVWDKAALHAAVETGQNLPGPVIEDLPLLIEQCIQILQKEGVRTSSFNLERLGDNGGSKSLFLNSALVRFKLSGNGEGIERGLAMLEELPDQPIYVQEAQLKGEGGEILLKIYFREPDNPSEP